MTAYERRGVGKRANLPVGTRADAGLQQRRRWLRLGERTSLVLCLAPAVILFATVYGGSMFRMLLLSLDAPQWSMTHYFEVIGDESLWSVLIFTVRLAAGITVTSLFLSYPVALVMFNASPRIQRLLVILLVLPLWTSTLVRSYAWMVLLSPRGVANEGLQAAGLISEPLPLLYNRFAVYVGMVHIMLPYMVFPIYSAMKQIDLRLLQAARSLGAGPTTARLLVFFPLSLPGVAVGCILVFVMSLAFWVTPTLLGGLSETTYVMIIEAQVNLLANWPLAAAMSVILLSVTLLVLLLYQKLLGFGLIGAEASGRQQYGTRFLYICANSAARARTIIAAVARSTGLSSLPRYPFLRVRAPSDNRQPRNLFSWIVTLFVIVYLLGPILILFPLSFSSSPFMEFPPAGYSLQWYERYFSGSDWIRPTLVSFQVATISMAVSTVVGTVAALAIVKNRFPFRRALLLFLLSPLVVPPIIIAVALYFQFAKFHLVGTIPGLVLAHLLLSIPFVLVVMIGTMQNFDYSLERAARSLGAGPLRTFRRVVLPLIWPGILTAGFFAFLVSFDEVIIAVFLSGTEAATLPKRLLDATRFEFRPTIAAISVLLITLSVAVVLVVDFAQQKLRRRSVRSINPMD